MRIFNFLFFILATTQLSYAQPKVFKAMNLTSDKESMWNDRYTYSRENVKNLRASFEYDENAEIIKVHYCRKNVGDDGENISTCIEKDYITTLTYSKSEFLTKLDVYNNMAEIKRIENYIKGHELMNCEGRSNHYDKYDIEEINEYAKKNPEFTCVDEKTLKNFQKDYLPGLIKQVEVSTNFVQAIIENADIASIREHFFKHLEGYGEKFYADFITFPHLNFVQVCMKSEKQVKLGQCTCQSYNQRSAKKVTMYSRFNSWEVDSYDEYRRATLVNTSTNETYKYGSVNRFTYSYLESLSHGESLKLLKSCTENPVTELQKISGLLEGEDCNLDAISSESKMSHISSEYMKDISHDNDDNTEQNRNVIQEK